MLHTFVKQFRSHERAARAISEIVPEAAGLANGFAAFEAANFEAESGSMRINSGPGFRSAIRGPQCIFEIYREKRGFTARIDVGGITTDIARRKGWREVTADTER